MGIVSAMDRKLILLVEDNDDDLALTLRAFRRHAVPAEVQVARDGIEALDYLLATGPWAGRPTERDPALILLDLNLPRMHGLEVLKRLRDDRRTRRTPVVVLTSSREDRDLAACYDLGVNSYVRKPIEYDEFATAVQQLGVYWLGLNEAPPAR